MSQTPTDPMGEIMSANEQLAELDADEIKELVVKDAVWKIFRQEMHARHGKNSFNNPEFDRFMDYATDYGVDGFFLYMDGHQGLVAGPAVDRMGDGPDALDDVFDSLTADDTTIEKARRFLASICRGSMGMPRDKIIRENVARMTE